MTRAAARVDTTVRAALLLALAQGLAVTALTACGSDGGAPASVQPDAARWPRGTGGSGEGSGGAGGNGGSGSSGGADAGESLPDAHAESDAAAPADAGASVAPDAAPGPLVCDGKGARFATGVVAHAFGTGQKIGQEYFPGAVFGPPEGAGECQGATLGVVSLGNGGTVTLEFAGNAIADAPGPDFIVFENAFGVDCNPDNLFTELATVAVSDDGETWTEFPCTATKAPYGACAGVHPVFANAQTNTLDATDPAVAGGDAFDLADIGVARARYVRITDRVDLTGLNGVFDLDAVSIVHPFCP